MTESEFSAFLDSTERQARKVLEASGTWPTYGAGIAFQSLAMGAMSATSSDVFRRSPALPCG